MGCELVITGITKYEAALSNQATHVATRNILLLSPKTEHVSVNKTKVYDFQFKCNLQCIASAELELSV